MRAAFVVMAGMALVSCGRSTDGSPAGSAAQVPVEPSSAALADKPVAGVDPCSLVADPTGLFGTPVTAKKSSMTGQTTCVWTSTDGRMCGTVTLFTPADNSSPDPKVNFAAMVTSLRAFGEVKDVSGIGDEAKVVDGGILGAQVALRTASHAALAASACRSGAEGPVELAQKLASEIVGKL